MKIKVFCSLLVFPAPNTLQSLRFQSFCRFLLCVVFHSVAALTCDEDQPNNDIDCGGGGQCGIACDKVGRRERTKTTITLKRHVHHHTKTTYAAQTSTNQREEENQVSLCTLHLFQNKEDKDKIEFYKVRRVQEAIDWVQEAIATS